MGRKIFISYKYADSEVKDLNEESEEESTVRNYVDELEKYLGDKSEHIYKGESDGEDLSNLSEETIWSKLKDRIYDSSLTIVIISKGMKESSEEDKNQWIPWEISYSLKEVSRKNKKGNPITSKTNAMLAIIIPDKNNSYEYYITSNKCDNCSGCREWYTNRIFNIMKKNMFNIKEPNTKTCDDGSVVYYGDSSYIISVKWDDFTSKQEEYIEKAYELQDNIDNYDICKEV